MLAGLNPESGGVPPLEGVDRSSLLVLAQMWSFAENKALHDRLRETIENMPEEFFPCTRAEATSRLGEFDATIAVLADELRAAEKQAALDAVETQFAVTS